MWNNKFKLNSRRSSKPTKIWLWAVAITAKIKSSAKKAHNIIQKMWKFKEFMGTPWKYKGKNKYSMNQKMRNNNNKIIMLKLGLKAQWI